MVPVSRVGVCLDETCGRKRAKILRVIRAPAAPQIWDIRELGLGGTTDEVLLAELAKRGVAALVTLDSSMLAASIRRDVWRVSFMSVFACEGRWGNISLFEQARRLLWWWPTIVAQIEKGPQGGAWRVPVDPKYGGFTRMYADETDSPPNTRANIHPP
jgi:hypothetical protein